MKSRGTCRQTGQVGLWTGFLHARPGSSPGVLPQHHRTATGPGRCRPLRSQHPNKTPCHHAIFLEVASLPSHAVNPLPMEANSNCKTNCFFCFFGAPISPNLHHRNDMRHSYDRRQINRSRIGIAIAVQREIAAQAFIFPLAAFLHSDCFFRSARPVC